MRPKALPMYLYYRRVFYKSEQRIRDQEERVIIEMKKDTIELWKDIDGYEGIYQVSNLGRVKSLDRTLLGKNSIEYKVKGKIRKISCIGKGYQKIQLSKEGNSKNFLIHRLVAQAFIPNPENLPIVNHIDGNKTNNHIGNLEWVSSSKNINHAISIGLRKTNNIGPHIKKEGNSGVTVKEKVEDILSVFPNMKTKDIAELVGSKTSYVYKIKKRMGMSEEEIRELHRDKNKSRRKKNAQNRKKESARVIDKTGEVWREVLGYEDSYEVSNYGRVKSLSRKMEVYRDGETHVRYYKERLMSLSTRARYPNVNLSRDGRIENFSIHRLVAQAFIPNPKNKPYVNHIDGDTHNNHVSNLEWVTQSENINHAIKIGNKEAKVEIRPATTTKQKIIDVLTVFPDMKTGKVAELVGCKPRYVTGVRHGWNN